MKRQKEEKKNQVFGKKLGSYMKSNKFNEVTISIREDQK